ncbi:MAG TPA: BTAD domain-containing putative transcriptional regulator [Candidatus Limnocylindrales bacterium]|nr:BTAD domain-containing putative transcriptional regulator [Candidatus Limnocylindrales bacterium]
MAATPGAELARRAIHLLGPVQVVVGGRPIAVDTRKAIALVAYLAVTGRPASREGLAALLWPESDGPAARGALRRTLSVLAAALGGRGIRIDRSTVALDGEWDVDVVTFREHLGRARSHAHPAGPCAACRSDLEAAAALDRGDFMAGFALRDSEAFDDWQLAEAEDHRRALAGLFERLALAREAAGDAGGTIEAGRRWLDLDPLHEPAHRLLMRVLASSGEQAAAIRQYRACVRVLDEELGVPPVAETTELYEAIRSGRLALERPTEPVRPVLAPPTRTPAANATAIPIVGRDGAIADLIASYRAIGPDGRLLVIEGEPGIGKTRLATTVADAVETAGGAVLATRAYAGEAAIAFGPIAALVDSGLDRADCAERLADLRPDELGAAARIVPRLRTFVPGRDASDGEPLDAIGRARAVEALAAVLTTLVSGARPGLLVVDDADWADASSTEALAFLARRLRNRPVGLLLTWRPLASNDVERRRMVADAERDGLGARVVLDRLAPADVARLARESLGDPVDQTFVDRLVADSEGLPLYVAEVLAAGDVGAGVPRGVLELLRLRLAGLGDIAHQVVAAASVVGRSFDFDIVREASGRSDDETVAAIEELAGRGIVVEIGTEGPDVRLDFTHARLREVVYDSLGLVRRRLLHRRVAEALRAAPGSGDLARWSRIAHHETEAGRPLEAAEAHRRAAATARAVFANREARDHLEAALALDGSDAGAMHESLGEVLTLLGDYGAAIAHLEAAAATPGVEHEWAIERGLALVHARLGDWDRAASHLDDAVAAAPDDPAVRSGLLADESAIRARLGDEIAAEAAGREALAVAEAADDLAGVARASHVLGLLARGRGALDEAAAWHERALTAIDHAADPGLRIASLNALALVRSAAGDRAAAITLLEEALRLGQRHGDRHRQAALENNLADLLRAEGRREVAMDHLKRAVAIFADIGGRPGVAEPEIWKLVEW